MLPAAGICHSTPSRTRVKVPARKGDETYFTLLRETFINAEWIEKIETNTLTGSVLFFHQGNAANLAKYAEEHKLFVLRPPSPAAPPLSKAVQTLFSNVNGGIKSFTGGDIDTPGLAFLLLLGIGIHQIGKGNFAAPAWYTAFWYALNIFLKSMPGATDNLT